MCEEVCRFRINVLDANGDLTQIDGELVLMVMTLMRLQPTIGVSPPV